MRYRVTTIYRGKINKYCILCVCVCILVLVTQHANHISLSSIILPYAAVWLSITIFHIIWWMERFSERGYWMKREFRFSLQIFSERFLILRRIQRYIITNVCGNKMPTRFNRWYLLQILLFAQHVSGHHYAHHQELESIIQMVAACGIWCFGFQVVCMVWSWRLCVRFAACKPET